VPATNTAVAARPRKVLRFICIIGLSFFPLPRALEKGQPLRNGPLRFRSEILKVAVFKTESVRCKVTAVVADFASKMRMTSFPAAARDTGDRHPRAVTARMHESGGRPEKRG